MKITTNIKRILISLVVLIPLFLLIILNNRAFVVENKFNYMLFILAMLVSIESYAIIVVKLDFNNKKSNIFYAIFSLMLSIIFSYMIIELLNHNTLFSISLKRLTFNFIIITLLHLLIYAISNSIKLTVILSNSILFLLGIINYTVICFRGTPLVPWDILSLKTAAYVANSYTFQFNFYILLAVCFYVFIISVGLKVKYIFFKKSNLIFRIISIFIIIILIFVFYKTDIINYFQFENNLWQPRNEYLHNGFLASFVKQSKNLFNTAPENYSSDNVQTILSKLESNHTSTLNNENPNIIVIMNESYSDLTVNR